MGESEAMRWCNTMAMVILLNCPLEAAETIDDPHSFLDVTADAISTAMARLQTGEMELEYHSTGHNLDTPDRGNVESTSLKMTGRVIWNESSSYAAFNLENRLTLRSDDGAEIIPRSGWNGPTEIIRTPSLWVWYVKDNQWCRRRTVNPHLTSVGRHVEVLDPQVTWFSTTQNPKQNHVHYGLTWRATDPAVDLTTIAAVDSSGRKMRVVRQKKGIDLVAGFVVDLDQGGMVIDGWVEPPPGNSPKRTSWSWKQDIHGVWYVAEWKHIVHSIHDRDRVTFTEQGTVTHFNSRPEIPKNRFAFASLKLPAGTRVENVTPQGTSYSYIGGKPAERSSFDLDSLLDDAQDGFAAPGRGPS